MTYKRVHSFNLSYIAQFLYDGLVLLSLLWVSLLLVLQHGVQPGPAAQTRDAAGANHQLKHVAENRHEVRIGPRLAQLGELDGCQNQPNSQLEQTRHKC